MSYVSLWELHEAPDLVALRGQKSMRIPYKPIQAQTFSFFKIALNRLLTLPDYRSRREISESSGIIDFENKNISVVTKH